MSAPSFVQENTYKLYSFTKCTPHMMLFHIKSLCFSFFSFICFTEVYCYVTVTLFVTSFAHFSFLTPICAEIHTNVILSAILSILYSTCSVSIKHRVSCLNGCTSAWLVTIWSQSCSQSSHIISSLQNTPLINHWFYKLNVGLCMQFQFCFLLFLLILMGTKQILSSNYFWVQNAVQYFTNKQCSVLQAPHQ